VVEVEDSLAFFLIFVMTVVTAGSVFALFYRSLKIRPLVDLNSLHTAIVVSASRPGTRLRVNLVVPEGSVVKLLPNKVIVLGGEIDRGYVSWLNRVLREAYGVVGAPVASLSASEIDYNFDLEAHLELVAGSYVLEVEGIRPGAVKVRLISCKVGG